jgi:hypothetical protein
MAGRHVEFTYEGKTYNPQVPSDVPDNKLVEFKEYALACHIRNQHEDTFTSKKGKTYRLPQQNKKAIANLLSKKEAVRFLEIDAKIRSLNGKVATAKRKVWGNYKSEARKELFEELRTYMLELLGRGMTAAEVHKKLLSQGYDVEYQHILDFHTKNRDKVTELRNKFNEDFNDVSISNKRSRLERLNLLLNEIMGDFEKANTLKLRESLSKEARGILDQARKEVEGEELKLTINGRIDIEATLNVALSDSNQLQRLTIQQLVISRVASRLGLKSQFLIDRLAHGFYSKFNGFRTNADLSTKPIYPSSINYDIVDQGVEAKYLKWAEKQDMYVEQIVDLDEGVQLKVDTAREIMGSRLRELLARNSETKETSRLL